MRADNRFVLDVEQTRIIKGFLSSSGANVCPSCSTDDFTVVPYLAFLGPPVDPRSRALTTTGMVCVSIMCRHCGHVRNFNLNRVGIDPSQIANA